MLQAVPGGTLSVGYSFDSRSWPAAPVQAVPVTAPYGYAVPQPQQLDKPVYRNFQPAIVQQAPQQLLQPFNYQQAAVQSGPPGNGNGLAAPLQLPLRSGSTSNSGSQEMDPRDSPSAAGPQLPRGSKPDTTIHSKGKVKATHRTAQKRYRERQKVSLAWRYDLPAAILLLHHAATGTICAHAGRSGNCGKELTDWAWHPAGAAYDGRGKGGGAHAAAAGDEGGKGRLIAMIPELTAASWMWHCLRL